MKRLRLTQLEGVAQLRAAATAWDDLWQRSEVALPTVRAELMAGWITHFAPSGRFVAMVVEQDGEWVAALPLVERRLLGSIPALTLPGNEWADAGDLLLDPQADVAPVLDQLIGALAKLPQRLLWLDGVELESSRWRALRQAADRAQLAVAVRPQQYVGQVDIDRDWPGYHARLSKGFRKNLRKAKRKLSDQGEMQVDIQRRFSAEEIERSVELCFEIEDRGWKGPASSSVVRTFGMLDFFKQQALELSKSEQLEILTLRHQGWPIAFDFGYRSKGVFFSHKVGFDEAYGEFGPGQLLMSEQIERYFDEPECRQIDCMGPLSDAAARWCTRAYQVGRLGISTERVGGRCLLGTYSTLGPLARKLRGIPAVPNLPRLGAEAQDSASGVHVGGQPGAGATASAD